MTEATQTRERQIAILTELAEQYHKDFCVDKPGVPQKPELEKTICWKHIYSAAESYGISGETMDSIMDRAEKQFAVYATAA